jgi:hypothetical protein
VDFAEAAREFELSFTGRRVLARITDSGGIDAVVKGTSEVVEPFTHENRDLWWRERLLNDPDDEPPFALVVQNDRPRVIFKPFVPEPRRLVAVGFSSVDALPTRVKWADHVLTWEGDAEAKRRRADTGDSARRGRANGNPDPDTGRGLS